MPPSPHNLRTFPPCAIVACPVGPPPLRGPLFIAGACAFSLPSQEIPAVCWKEPLQASSRFPPSSFFLITLAWSDLSGGKSCRSAARFMKGHPAHFTVHRAPPHHPHPPPSYLTPVFREKSLTPFICCPGRIRPTRVHSLQWRQCFPLAVFSSSVSSNLLTLKASLAQFLFRMCSRFVRFLPRSCRGHPPASIYLPTRSLFYPSRTFNLSERTLYSSRGFPLVGLYAAFSLAQASPCS